MSGRLYSSRLHDDAMLAAITQICGALPEPRQVGDGGGDADGPIQKDLTLPYAVVYPLGSTQFDGSIAAADVDADAWPTTQVTFCASTRAEAAWLQDAVRQQLVGTTLAVAGRSLGVVRLHGQRPASRDTTVTPYVYWAVDLYRCFTSPA